MLSTSDGNRASGLLPDIHWWWWWWWCIRHVQVVWDYWIWWTEDNVLNMPQNDGFVCSITKCVQVVILSILGPFFPCTIKSNLISTSLIADQLDAQNWSSINCLLLFYTFFDLQLSDPRFVDSPLTEPILCKSDWLTVTSICSVVLNYPACTPWTL